MPAPKRIVITGVSRGLGKALVDGFVARGHVVFGCARSAKALAELRRRNVHNFLLVTSSYHTARAGRTYGSLAGQSGGGLTFRTVAAPAEFFLPESWWRVRESRKIVFNEWIKTIAATFGL